CRHCSDPGHITSHCRKRNFCNYCKRPGHIILDCQRRNNRTAGNGGSNRSSPGFSQATTHSAVVASVEPIRLSSELDAHINQVVRGALTSALPSAIQSAFSAFGLSGTSS
ncbi:Gag polyprotein, partial [Linum grandiflorum]